MKNPKTLQSGVNFISDLGHALNFFKDVTSLILQGQIRIREVIRQIYEQGYQSILIIVLTSLASGTVLALQGYAVTVRFGAKEAIPQLVALSLIRELSPVFTALIFSGKVGSRMTAELGTMNVNDQMLATRTLGVNPLEYFVVPRVLACFIVLPMLTVISEIIGIAGGYLIGTVEAHLSGAFYINQTLKYIHYVDFFSGYMKTVFFSILIGWICCYHGYTAKGGSLGVGQCTTLAVAYSYIFVVLSNTVLTKFILTFWG